MTILKKEQRKDQKQRIGQSVNVMQHYAMTTIRLKALDFFPLRYHDMCGKQVYIK